MQPLKQGYATVSKKLPSVIDSADSLLLLDGSIIALNSSKFLVWLENNQSFRFDCGLAGKEGYTARKERSGYWYAYKKIAGKLYKSYIGTADEIAIPRLIEVAQKLQNPNTVQPKQRLDKQVVQQLQTDDKGLQSEVVQQLYTTIEEMQRTMALLNQRIEALETAKKPESSPFEDEGMDGYTIQLGKRVNELKALARDLKEENEQLKAENEALATQLETAQKDIVQLEQSQAVQLPEAQSEKQLTPEVNTKTLNDFLSSLKLGKQSPDYKAAKRWIARFIEFVTHHPKCN